MKIETIHIQNFKSIKDLTIHCNDGLNAFIGKNGTGKSAVFEALLHHTDIEVELLNPPQVNGYSLNQPISTSGNNGYNRGLMKGIRVSIIKIDTKNISANSTTGGSQGLFSKNILSLFQETLFPKTKNVNGGIDEILLNFNNRKYCTQAFRDNLSINGYDFHQLSSGEKVIFLLEAFSKILEKTEQENKNFLPKILLIDEPELYLHPQAKKSLYNTLKKLAEKGIQIFYITHSAEFLSYESPDLIHRFYYDNEMGTQSIKGKEIEGFSEIDKSIEQNKLSYNSAFFADKLFLVEGYSDELFLRHKLRVIVMSFS